MRKLVDGYWIFGLAACLFYLPIVYIPIDPGPLVYVLVCIFIVDVGMRGISTPEWRASHKIMVKNDWFVIFLFWPIILLLQIGFCMFFVQAITAVFIVKDFAGQFPPQFETILAYAAPFFFVVAWLCMFMFDTLFCIKACKRWKRLIEMNKTDREKKK